MKTPEERAKAALKVFYDGNPFDSIEAPVAAAIRAAVEAERAEIVADLQVWADAATRNRGEPSLYPFQSYAEGLHVAVARVLARGEHREGDR